MATLLNPLRSTLGGIPDPIR